MPTPPTKFGLVLAFLLAGCATYTPEPADVGQMDEAFQHRSLPQAAKPWTAESLISAAESHDIGRRQANAKVASAEAACVTAGASPNPSLSLVPGVNTSASNAPSGMPALSLDFIVETAGKRDLRLSKARQSLAAANIAREESRWQLRLKVRQAFRELGLAKARRAALTIAQKAQLELVTRLRRQLAAGSATPAEVRTAELATHRSQLELDDALAAELEAGHRLAEATGLPEAALKKARFDFRAPLTQTADLPRDARGLRGAALARRADLAIALTEYAIEEANVAIEVARQYPDLHLSPGYQWDQGASKWQLGLGTELPLFNHNEGPIAEAVAHRKEAVLRLAEIQEKISSEVERALDGLRQASRTYTDAQAVVDNLTLALASVQRRRAAGAAEGAEETLATIDLANARVALIERETKLRRAVETYESATHVTLAGEPSFGPPSPLTSP